MYFETVKLFQCQGCSWKARNDSDFPGGDDWFESLIEQHEYIMHGIESDLWPTPFQRRLGLAGGFGQMFLHHGSTWGRGGYGPGGREF